MFTVIPLMEPTKIPLPRQIASKSYQQFSSYRRFAYQKYENRCKIKSQGKMLRDLTTSRVHRNA